MCAMIFLKFVFNKEWKAEIDVSCFHEIGFKFQVRKRSDYQLD
jgi:hypothetical protein